MVQITISDSLNQFVFCPFRVDVLIWMCPRLKTPRAQSCHPFGTSSTKLLSYIEDLPLGDGPRVAAYLPPEFRPGVADAVGSIMPAVSGVSILPTAFLTGRVLRYFVGVQRSDEIPPMRI